MLIIQKQIHLGTFKKVGFLDNETLKEISIEKINKNYNSFFKDLSLKNIILTSIMTKTMNNLCQF